MTTGIQMSGELTLDHLLAHLACPSCHTTLHVSGRNLCCRKCRRTYPTLPQSGAPNLLPDETLTYEASAAARALKIDVQRRFAMIDRTLPRPHATFATFLNLGYVPNDNPQCAVRGPRRPTFNRNSTTLLFEVLGQTDLDGKVVFDLGAGRGGNVSLIGQYYAPQAIYGLDLSQANVEFCAQNHAIVNGGFAVADVEYLPILSATVDVVLNLESSHYYPNLLRFFDEVYRVLAPQGEFLYADILPTETLQAAREHFSRIGFEVQRDQDISANVLLSCEAIGKLRLTSRYAKLYETFEVVPGSIEFEQLQTGLTQYRILNLRKSLP